jgi:hypothetical protein
MKITCRKLYQITCVSTVAFLAVSSGANAPIEAIGPTPKFFICPQEMTRYSTVMTTKHDLNLCGKDGGQISLLAVRIHGTHRVVRIPILSSQHPVYVAKSATGIYYTLDTGKKLLTIKAKNGRVSREQVIASD